MHKRDMHRLQRRVSAVNQWLLFGAAVLLFGLFIYAYRQNNVRSLELAAAVTVADQQNGDVEAALRRLREHMHSHMNAGLSSEGGISQPIQLKARYERLVAAENARVEAINSQVYTDAQADCERRIPDGLSGRVRIDCVQQYVDSRSVKPQPIPDALYKFDFVAPAWSPDLAGWSLVAAVVCGALFAARLGLERWLQYRLHQ